MVVAAVVVKLWGPVRGFVLSMIPKSVTTPIAVEISGIIGGERPDGCDCCSTHRHPGSYVWAGVLAGLRESGMKGQWV